MTVFVGERILRPVKYMQFSETRTFEDLHLFQNLYPSDECSAAFKCVKNSAREIRNIQQIKV
jgi:hypothetical protein